MAETLLQTYFDPTWGSDVIETRNPFASHVSRDATRTYLGVNAPLPLILISWLTFLNGHEYSEAFLQNYKRGIIQNPYQAKTWLDGARILSFLGYSESALDDRLKARLLLEMNKNDHSTFAKGGSDGHAGPKEVGSSLKKIEYKMLIVTLLVLGE